MTWLTMPTPTSTAMTLAASAKGQRRGAGSGSNAAAAWRPITSSASMPSRRCHNRSVATYACSLAEELARHCSNERRSGGRTFGRHEAHEPGLGLVSGDDARDPCWLRRSSWPTPHRASHAGQCLRHVFFHHLHRDAAQLRDLRIGPLMHPAEQEHLAALGRQPFDGQCESARAPARPRAVAPGRRVRRQFDLIERDIDR